jgi:hypothetical protein
MHISNANFVGQASMQKVFLVFLVFLANRNAFFPALAVCRCLFDFNSRDFQTFQSLGG